MVIGGSRSDFAWLNRFTSCLPTEPVVLRPPPTLIFSVLWLCSFICSLQHCLPGLGHIPNGWRALMESNACLRRAERPSLLDALVRCLRCAVRLSALRFDCKPFQHPWLWRISADFLGGSSSHRLRSSRGSGGDRLRWVRGPGCDGGHPEKLLCGLTSLSVSVSEPRSPQGPLWLGFQLWMLPATTSVFPPQPAHPHPPPFMCDLMYCLAAPLPLSKLIAVLSLLKIKKRKKTRWEHNALKVVWIPFKEKQLKPLCFACCFFTVERFFRMSFSAIGQKGKVLTPVAPFWSLLSKKANRQTQNCLV